MVFKKKKSGFQYKQRPDDSIKKREQQSGSSREGFIKQDVKVWTPLGGLNKVRFLPPTWDDAGHFGLDVWVHYQVGPDGNAYLCLKRNSDLHEPEDCPCCEARQRWSADGHEEAADGLNAKKRVLAYIIDRNREHDGVVLWPMPYTVDRDLAGQCQDEETGEMYFIDHPDTGYDVWFTRDGQGQTTKYRTPKLGKKPKAISEDQDQQDEWLEWIEANPIPDMLIWADPEAIEEALQGGPGGQRERFQDKLKGRARRGAEDEDEEEDGRLSSRGAKRRARAVEEDEEEDEPPPKRRRAGVDDEDEEEKALRGKSRKVSKRDEDEEEDEEDEDDDEEETPRRGRVVKTTSRTSKTRAADEDDDDEDEAEAERPRSSRVAAKGKASSADPDDDEDDDGPPKRSLGKDSVKSKISGKLGRLRR